MVERVLGCTTSFPFLSMQGNTYPTPDTIAQQLHLSFHDCAVLEFGAHELLYHATLVCFADLSA